MNDPLQLDGLAAEIWGWLARGRADRRSPFRTPVIATTDAQGVPSARTVVLRAVDASKACLEFHTDARSPKVKEIGANRAVAWLFYDPKRQLQIRATTEATLHVGDAVAEQAWTTCALASRAPYLVTRAPGSAVGSGEGPEAVAPPHVRSAEQSEPGREHFVVARCRVQMFDVLQLHPRGHRRARVEVGAPKSAAWIVP